MNRSHPGWRYIRLFLYPRGGINEPRDRLSARPTPERALFTSGRGGNGHAVPFCSIYSATETVERKVSGRESGRAESFAIRNHSVPRASSIWGWRWIMHPSPPRDEHPPFYSPANHRPLIVFRYATVRIRNDLRLPFVLSRPFRVSKICPNESVSI